MKTVFLAVVLACSATIASAAGPLFETFAKCSGQLSAAMEHAWLTQSDDADTLKQQREDTVRLLNAVTPQGLESAAMNARVHAKFALAALLTTATFSPDKRRADWAKARSTRQIRHCQSLLLKS